MSGNRIRSVKSFFLIYYCIIAVLLLWNLAHCAEMTWESRDVFLRAETGYAEEDSYSGSGDGEGQEGTAVELLDGEPLLLYSGTEEASSIGRKAKLCGIALLNYDNENELRFSEETIRAEVCEEGSREVLGTAVMPLRNQTPYPEDEMQVYLAFPEAVEQTAELPLEIRISTDGLTRNGIFFSPVQTAPAEQTGAREQTEAPESDGSQQQADPSFQSAVPADDRAQQGPIALAYYEKKTFHVFENLVYFLLEALLGLICMVLCREKKLPLLRRSGSGSAAEGTYSGHMDARGGFFHAGPDAGRGPRFFVKKLSAPAVLLLLCLLLFSYTNDSAVRKTAESMSVDSLMSGSVKKDRVKLKEGETVRQTIRPRQDSLTGFGVWVRRSLTDIEGEEIFSLTEARTVLSWNLLDEEGAVLSSGNARVGELASVDTVAGENTVEEAVEKAMPTYVLLPLEEPVADSAGRKLTLEITAQETEEIRLQASRGGNGTLTVDGDTRNLELCLLGVYDNNGFLKGFFFKLCVFLLLFMAAAWFLAYRLRERAAAMYLVCALAMGLVFSFMTPPYTVPDERAHIDTVYALSNRFLGIDNPGGPMRIRKRVCDVDTSVKNTMPISVDRYRWETELFGSAADGVPYDAVSTGENSPEGDRSLKAEAAGTALTTVYARNALANGTVFCYLPAAVGLTAARLLGRNMATMVMAARWMNLLACALLIALAVKRMPFGGMAMAVAALFPRSLQLLSSCSYDGMLIAGTYVFTAWCFFFLCEEEYTVADVMILAFSAMHVALCKGGAYLPLVGLVLLVPLMKRGLTKNARRRWLRAGLLLLAAGLFLFFIRHLGTVFGMFSREAGSTTLFAGTKTLYTMSDFRADPGSFPVMVMNTLQVRNDSMVGEMVGHILMKQNRLVYAFLFLAFLGILKKKGEEEQVIFTIPGRIWVLLLAAAATALISLSMLLAYTAADAYYIEGVQGRYFLPMLPMLYFAAENRWICRNGLEDTAVLYAADLLLVMTVCQILLVSFSGL